jgi:hypothetical protein
VRQGTRLSSEKTLQEHGTFVDDELRPSRCYPSASQFQALPGLNFEEPSGTEEIE